MSITWSPLALLALLVCASSLAARDFHVSTGGDDAAPGTRELPWKTLARVNTADLEPGDRVLLEGGQTFAGSLALDAADSGSPAARVEVGSHGEKRATIDAGTGSGLEADGCDYLTVKGLRIIGVGRKDGSHGHGILIQRAEGLEIEDLEVSGFRKEGIQLSRVRRARITRSHAHDNGAAGISVEGDHFEGPSEDVTIADCVAENNPGDPSNLQNHSGSGIVVAKVRRCVIERCEAMKNGWDMPRPGENGPVGIWAWNVDRVTIQSCISHHNRSTGRDGGGFDLDGGVTNSVLQYNLSYENQGSGFFLCTYPGAPEWKNNVIRYNVSWNDQSGIEVAAVFTPLSGAEIHNNTVVTPRLAPVRLFQVHGGDWSGISFRNNVFVAGDTPFIRYEGVKDPLARRSDREVFRHNLYWTAAAGGFRVLELTSLDDWSAATGQERLEGRRAGIFADPRLASPRGPMPAGPRRLAELEAFRLEPGSPCIGAGISIEGSGGRDFFGNEVPGGAKPCIGAHERR